MCHDNAVCRASHDLLLQLIPQYLEQLIVAQLSKKLPGMELEGLSPIFCDETLCVLLEGGSTCCLHLAWYLLGLLFHLKMKQYVPLQCWWSYTRLHGVSSQKTVFSIITAVTPPYQTKFITIFTRACNWPLSWPTSIQSTPFDPVSLGPTLILSHLHQMFPICLCSSCFPTRTSYIFLFSPAYTTCPTHLILLEHIACLAYSSVLKMEAVYSSETLVHAYQTTWSHNLP